MKQRAKLLISATILTAFMAHAAIAGEEALGLVTGAKTGTYYLIGEDIKKVADEAGIPLTLRESGGSVDNLQKMATTGENAALGIVQSDVIAFLMRSDKPRSREIARKLRLVLPLFKEEVHILARNEIATFDDLKDKRVVVGSSGSGSMMTAVNMLARLGVKPKRLYEVSPAEAAVAVLANRADAMVYVAGKPIPLFKNMQNLAATNDPQKVALLNTVHFLEVPSDKANGLYEMATLTPQDYTFVKTPISTLAVRSALVSFDFTLKNTPYYKQRCNQLKALGQALARGLPDLQATGHRKWQEVDLERPLTLWKHDRCAWAGIQSYMAGNPQGGNGLDIDNPRAPQTNPEAPTNAPAQHSPFEEELLNIITGAKAP